MTTWLLKVYDINTLDRRLFDAVKYFAFWYVTVSYGRNKWNKVTFIICIS